MSGGDDVAAAMETLAGAEWIDLTHTLEEGIPTVPTHARYGHTLYETYERGDEACHYRVTLGEHNGTHMDAPLHFVPEGDAHYDIADITVDRLAGRAATVDATHLDGGETLAVETIEAWEADHGDIEAGDRVLFRFGWEERWDTGAAGRAFLDDWPGLSADAAAYLTGKGATLVGCDTLAIDAAGAEGSPVHHELLGNETYIVENLANLEDLPAFCTLFTLPLKIREGSGSPIRAVAVVD